jgi:hypothetical protein
MSIVQPNRLFLALFLRCQPADMRDHLAAQDLKTPADMAALAYRLINARPQGIAVAGVADCRGRAEGPQSSTNRRRSPFAVFLPRHKRGT